MAGQLNIRFIVICSAMVSLLTGCVSYPDYPDRWAAPIETQDACATLTGSHEDVGAFGNSDEYTRKTKPRLRYYFFENAQALEGENVLAETEYAEKASTLVCRKDSAEIGIYHGLTRDAGNPLVGYQYDTTRLLKAEDGALVVKSAGGGIGLVYLFLPMAVGGHYWYRFPAAE